MFLTIVVTTGTPPPDVRVIVSTLSDSVERFSTAGSRPSTPTVPVPVIDVVPSDTV